MNDDRDASWSELMTLRNQLREAFNAEQHANADARRASTTPHSNGAENARQRPTQKNGYGLMDRVRTHTRDG